MDSLPAWLSSQLTALASIIKPPTSSAPSFHHIALQFPDELLFLAPRTSYALQTLLQSAVPIPSFYILGDTSYGSCCVDCVAASHVEADLIVHVGRACLSPLAPAAPAVVYLFDDQPLIAGSSIISQAGLVADVIAAAVPAQTPILLFPDCPRQWLALEVAHRLNQSHSSSSSNSNRQIAATFHSVVTPASWPNSYSPPGSISPPLFDLLNRRAYLLHGSPPQNTLKLSDFCIVFLGPTDGLLLSSILLQCSSVCAAGIWSVPACQDPASLSCTLSSGPHLTRSLSKRFVGIDQARGAQMIGLLAGTLSVDRYRDLISLLKTALRDAGRKPYLISIGKLNPQKLANFAEIDLFVLIACSENSMLDWKSLQFQRPIITPYELLYALDHPAASAWNGGYSPQFQTLLQSSSNGNSAPPTKSPSLEVGHLLRSDLIRNMPPEEAALIISPATSFFSQRSWQGLRLQSDSAPALAAPLVEGQSGIPAAYIKEKDLLSGPTSTPTT